MCIVPPLGELSSTARLREQSSEEVPITIPSLGLTYDAERRSGRRPIMFTTNGFETYFRDDQSGPQREVSGVSSKPDSGIDVPECADL